MKNNPSKYADRKKSGARSRRAAPASFKLLPPDMTDAQELALALVLWKSLRSHALLRAQPDGTAALPSDDSVDAAEKAIYLATKTGVKDEFLKLMFELRLVRISLTPME